MRHVQHMEKAGGLFGVILQARVRSEGGVLLFQRWRLIRISRCRMLVSGWLGPEWASVTG